jgi:hypothetical protein
MTERSFGTIDLVTGHRRAARMGRANSYALGAARAKGNPQGM